VLGCGEVAGVGKLRGAVGGDQLCGVVEHEFVAAGMHEFLVGLRLLLVPRGRAGCRDLFQATVRRTFEPNFGAADLQRALVDARGFVAAAGINDQAFVEEDFRGFINHVDVLLGVFRKRMGSDGQQQGQRDIKRAIPIRGALRGHECLCRCSV